MLLSSTRNESQKNEVEIGGHFQYYNIGGGKFDDIGMVYEISIIKQRS